MVSVVEVFLVVVVFERAVVGMITTNVPCFVLLEIGDIKDKPSIMGVVLVATAATCDDDDAIVEWFGKWASATDHRRTQRDDVDKDEQPDHDDPINNGDDDKDNDEQE